MRRASRFALLPLLVLFSYALLGQAPGPTVKVKLRAALFDRDLNLKPVPHLAITFRNLDSPGLEPVVAQTSLDGIAELELKPAAYKLTTTQPVELTGKTFVWDFEIKLLKAENLVELSNDNARITDVTGGRGARVDELAEQYQRVKESVVTVWAEDYPFDGVLVDSAGLVVTSYSMVEGHDWLAVQFGGTHKLQAQVLAYDKPQDVAVLGVNLEPIAKPVVAQIAVDPGALIEGERVFTVKNPFGEAKTLITGTVSKATHDAINADVKVSDPGGALFNSTGMVVGFIRVSGEELRLVPIAVATDSLKAAQAKMKLSGPPSARLLPCYPETDYPQEALRAKPIGKWEKDIYYSKLGNFEIELYTPVSQYAATREQYLAASKERDKYLKKGKEAPPVPEPEYKYAPVLGIEVRPGVSMAFWKSFGDSVLTDGHAPSTYRYKGSFVRMKLLCGSREVEPIWPRRVPVTGYSFANYSKAGYSVVKGGSYKGSYVYPHDGVSPECGQVTLEITSAKDEKPLVKVLDPKIVNRLWEDFADYRKLQAATTPSRSEK